MFILPRNFLYLLHNLFILKWSTVNISQTNDNMEITKKKIHMLIYTRCPRIPFTSSVILIVWRDRGMIHRNNFCSSTENRNIKEYAGCAIWKQTFCLVSLLLDHHVVMPEDILENSLATAKTHNIVCTARWGLYCYKRCLFQTTS